MDREKNYSTLKDFCLKEGMDLFGVAVYVLLAAIGVTSGMPLGEYVTVNLLGSFT